VSRPGYVYLLLVTTKREDINLQKKEAVRKIGKGKHTESISYILYQTEA
jgi:hypothetical protein